MRQYIIRLAVAAAAFAIGVILTLSLFRPGERPIIPAVSAALTNAQMAPVMVSDIRFVRDTADRLREVKVDPFDPRVPPAARPLLTLLKHQLRDLIYETINAQGNLKKSPQVLQADILATLTGDGVMVKDSEEMIIDESYTESDYAYGDIYNISIRHPPSHSDLLVATTTIGVCCGNDSSFYIFKRTGAHWELILAQEANDYEEVSGAQGRFDYVISPPDADSSFFVVTANVNPWCTSNWQSIRHTVFRVGDSPYEPRIIASGEDMIYLGVERPYKLAIGRDWFSINFTGEASNKEIERGETTKRHPVKYLIKGEKAEKISK